MIQRQTEIIPLDNSSDYQNERINEKYLTLSVMKIHASKLYEIFDVEIKSKSNFIRFLVEIIKNLINTINKNK